MRTGHATEKEQAERTRLEKEIAAQPGNPELLIEYGALLFEPFHETDGSRAALEEALSRSPGDARALFWLAKIAVHRELDDDKARALLERALAAAPDRPECLALMISVLAGDRKHSATRAELASRLVFVAPDWPRAHELRAEVSRNGGRIAEAQLEYTEALRLMEEFRAKGVPRSYFDEAVTGRYATDEAVARLREALAASPSGA